MNDLVICTRCNKKFLHEEYDMHRCMPTIKNWKTIRFASFYIQNDELGRKIITIRAMDGTNFEFIEVPENKEYTKKPYQPRGNTDNLPTSKQNPIKGSVKSASEILPVKKRRVSLI